jgi:hypothetical protein
MGFLVGTTHTGDVMSMNLETPDFCRFQSFWQKTTGVGAQARAALGGPA